MTATRPIPPTVRKFAIENDADSVRRFDAENETLKPGYTFNVAPETDPVAENVRIKPDDAPDGYKVVSVTLSQAGDLSARVQIRPED